MSTDINRPLAINARHIGGGHIQFQTDAVAVEGCKATSNVEPEPDVLPVSQHVHLAPVSRETLNVTERLNPAEYLRPFTHSYESAQRRGHPVSRLELLSAEGDPIHTGKPGFDVSLNAISFVPGSRRSYCRVEGCDEFTWGNVRAGYCATHLLLHLQGVAQDEKPGFPPMQNCRCD